MWRATLTLAVGLMFMGEGMQQDLPPGVLLLSRIKRHIKVRNEGRSRMSIFPGVTSVLCGVLCFGQGQDKPEKPNASEVVPSIEISSVTTVPSVIHRAGERTNAVIEVQVANSGGKYAPNSQATVAVVTYRAEPPDSSVEYLDSPQTQTLGASPTVFKFKVKATENTRPGRIVVLADIRAATEGIVVREPNPPSLARAELS